MADNLLDLAERVERATGPDRELDADIALATGWKHRSGADWHRVLEWERPAWTASLDAAMQLVPEGMERRVLNICSSGQTRALIYYNKAMRYCSGDAATPALALTAACLRAHHAMLEDKG